MDNNIMFSWLDAKSEKKQVFAIMISRETGCISKDLLKGIHLLCTCTTI